MFIVWLILFVLLPGPSPIFAQEPENELLESAVKFNIPMNTLGGKQFWSDVVHFHKWRIQENAVTGHFRLLDPRDVRYAWGSREECQEKLDQIKSEQDLKPMTGRVVLVLHGLGRGRAKMDVISRFLEKNGFTVCNISYASTRRTLDDHARTIQSVIDSMPEVSEFDIVGHSLGNIVTRRYLHEISDKAGQCLDPRFKKMVMLGPPNQGARMAAIFGDSALFSVVTGASGVALGVGWKEVADKLTTPSFEFGIIAGAGHPYTPPNPLIDGDDDFLVAVEETKLPGAADFIVLPTNHATMTEDQIVLDAILSFLKHGYFVSPEKVNPLPKE